MAGRKRVLGHRGGLPDGLIPIGGEKIDVSKATPAIHFMFCIAAPEELGKTDLVTMKAPEWRDGVIGKKRKPIAQFWRGVGPIIFPRNSIRL